MTNILFIKLLIKSEKGKFHFSFFYIKKYRGEIKMSKKLAIVGEFKEFITKGNVLDLAVGVIIGGAFTSIVNALVNGIITPLIGIVIKLVTGYKDVGDATKGLVYKTHGVSFDYGSVISAVITFLITAFVLFLIVKAVNKAQNVIPIEKEDVEAPETTDQILGDIRLLLQEQAKQNDASLATEDVKAAVEEGIETETKG